MSKACDPKQLHEGLIPGNRSIKQGEEKTPVTEVLDCVIILWKIILILLYKKLNRCWWITLLSLFSAKLNICFLESHYFQSVAYLSLCIMFI